MALQLSGGRVGMESQQRPVLKFRQEKGAPGGGPIDWRLAPFGAPGEG